MKMLARLSLALIVATALFSTDAQALESCPSGSLLFYHDLKYLNPDYRCTVGNVVFGGFQVDGYPGPPEESQIRPTISAGGWLGFEILPVGLVAGTFTGDQLRAAMSFTTYAPTDAMRISGASINAYTIHSGTYAIAQVQMAEGLNCGWEALLGDAAYIRVSSESGTLPVTESRNPVSLGLASDRRFCGAMEIAVGDEILNRPGAAGGAGIGSANFQVRVVPEPNGLALILTAGLVLCGTRWRRRFE